LPACWRRISPPAGAAGAPYLAAAAPAPNLPFALGANLAAFALAMVTAFCGSWFAQPR
jgi:hypothetical protein